jgi:hypothetical protein
MDNRLFSMMQGSSSVFNQAVIDGIAYRDIKSAKQYIEKIIRCAEQQYPPGLVFIGSHRVDPYEEYRVVTHNTKSNNKSNSRTFDLAHSDVYLVKYEFTYFGEKLDPQYLYLPYVRKGGLIYISGKQFAISPVLADRLFSVGMDDIFIPMPRGKVTFNYQNYSFICDGQRVSKNVAWSSLHNRDAKKNKMAKSTMIHLARTNSTLMHYLLCKFGFEETFKMYGKADVQCIHEDQATPENYPPADWVLCRSTKSKPDAVRIRREAYAVIASPLVLVIPRSQFSELLEYMVAGFYYAVDHFPDAMDEEYVKWSFQWRVMMGWILFGDEPGSGKLEEDVTTHLKSLDGYVDLDVTENLKSEGIDCKHIYDLFGYIIENMPDMLRKASGNVGSMYGKQLMVLRYVLKDINNSIFEFLFKLTSNNKKVLTKQEINTLLGNHFRIRQILKLNSGKGHGEVSSVSSPNDNMFFKITSNLVQQQDTAGKGKGRETKPVDETMYLNASFAEAGGYIVLPKSAPIGNTRLSPNVRLGPFNLIERNPEYIDKIDDVQNKIRRK